jgi:hypothetical protein
MSSVSKEIIYYTNNICDEWIMDFVMNKLKEVRLPIISVSHKPMDFGRNIVVDLPSARESIFKQIVIGLQASTADVVYLVEHDVLYHREHFQHEPRNVQHFLYNQNVWQVDVETGTATFRESKRTSQLIAYRDELLYYFDQLAERMKNPYGGMIGVAPRTHRIEGVNTNGVRGFMSEWPNIDFRHKDNISKYVHTNEIEATGVPLWGETEGRFGKWFSRL